MSVLANSAFLPQDPNQDHPLQLVLLSLQSPLLDQLLDISCSPTTFMSLTSAGYMFFQMVPCSMFAFPQDWAWVQ